VNVYMVCEVFDDSGRVALFRVRIKRYSGIFDDTFELATHHQDFGKGFKIGAPESV
jgi:hypothetical protein